MIKKFSADDGRYSTYTKQSFSEARQKLSSKAFSILNDEFVQRFYEYNDFKKYKDYRLLAVDGSCMEVPNSEELRKYYGYAINSLTNSLMSFPFLIGFSFSLDFHFFFP